MKKYRFLSIIPLLLFLIFAICAFVTLVSGIKTVNTLSSVGDDNRILRTALQYISTRYHSASPGCVFVHEFEEIPTLTISQEIDGVRYLTRIYCYDGYLRELFTDENNPAMPEDGEKLILLDGFEIYDNARTVTVTVTSPGGEKRELILSKESTSYSPLDKEGGQA